jgi:preprotein translocase subunit SecD
MTRGWYLKTLLVVGLCALAAYLLYPSYYFYYKATEQQRNEPEKFCSVMPSWMHCKKFNLGLDLQGGVHLVLGVEVQKAVEQRVDRLADALRDGMKEQKIPFTRIDRPRDTADVVVTLAKESDVPRFEQYLRKERQALQVVRHSGASLTLTMGDKEADYVKESAVDQAIKTIRNRADKLGVTEPTIAKRGSDNILIQLPGIKDPDHAISVIGRTAQLEFKMVDAEGTAIFNDIPQADLPAGTSRRDYTFDGPGGRTVREVYFEVPVEQKEALDALLRTKIPSDREIGYSELAREGVGTDAKIKTLRTYLLYARPGITGDYLTNAQVQQNPEMPSDYYVTMEFDPKGAKIFERLTTDNVRRQMAIVLDGKVNSAPIIQEKIGGGTARITLGGTQDPQQRFQEAKDLSLVLKAGALPAPGDVREKREVGKTLGKDAVDRGMLAMIVGSLAVILFMALYYRGSGLIANIGLFYHLLLLMASLAFFEATLTLPGFAGIALTLAMGVDANVLICERIREELRLGKTPRAAIEAGYSKAFSAIFDSNVTTIISAIVLMQYGSGPVRGFAVTLLIGLVWSLFASIVVTRLVYDFINSRWRLKSLSI